MMMQEYRLREIEKNQERIRKGYQIVPHTYSKDGELRFGNTIELRHEGSGVRVCNDLWTQIRDDEYMVFGELEEEDDMEGDSNGATARSTFVLVQVDQANTPNRNSMGRFDREDSKKLHYGQAFQLMCNPSLLFCEKTEMMRPPFYLKANASDFGEQASSLSLTRNPLDAKTHFVITPASCALKSSPFEKEIMDAKNKVVHSFDKISVKSRMTNKPLGLGAREGVANQNPAAPRASTYKLQVGTGNNEASNTNYIWRLRTADRPEYGIDNRNLPARLTKPQELLKKVRELLCYRCHNVYGIRELSREFRLMDTSRDGLLGKEEMDVGLRKFGIELDQEQIEILFKHVDANNSNSVDITEFFVALRGPLSKRRLKFIMMAYDILDRDGNGTVTLEEISSTYDTSCHPDVIDGRKTKEEVLKEFVSQWDNGGAVGDEESKVGDGIITKAEFVHYYRDVSASIDDDDYFELMMRNAWHISGGSGWCENSSNIRCLVVHTDDSQEVVELLNDFGISRNDMPAIRTKLRQQGVKNIKRVSLAD